MHPPDDNRTDDISMVSYDFSASDLSDQFDVKAFNGVEELNRPYRLSVDLLALDEATDTDELLGRDVRLTIARNHFERQFDGIVSRVSILDDGRTQHLSRVEIVPALSALGLSISSRIFQDKSAVEIIETVLREELGVYSRSYDSSSLDRDRYLPRNYCVQYQESHLDFVHRLMEEEGIGYYFSHDDPEQLVMFDANTSLLRAPTVNEGPVVYDATARASTGAEPFLRFASSSRLATTKVSLRDHDWTRRRAAIDASSTSVEEDGRSRADARAHEVYEHGFGRHVTIREDNELLGTLVSLLVDAELPNGPTGLPPWVHDLAGLTLDGFTKSDSEYQATIRRELLRRDRAVFTGTSLATHLSPGRTFELIGHPTLGFDGEFFATKVSHLSSAVGLSHDDRVDPEQDEQRTLWNYHNTFECRRLDTTWRPTKSARKPRIYGVQTAVVTGPAGMDVHTDQHGRVKVKFQWDRSDLDVGGNYTCWLRVSQSWAGSGSPGIIFIPRIGMEVIVSFVDGDPDRPLVTGCVYNGANTTPGMLPVQATKSIIRTRTVPHGRGYNELSFEDAMGKERVHIRAQRDLDELVLRDRREETKRNHARLVGGEEHVRIRKSQWVSVGHDREVIVRRHERVTTDGDYSRFVGKSAQVHVERSHLVRVEGNSTSSTQGRHAIDAQGALVLSQGDKNHIAMTTADGVENKGILIETQGASLLVTDDKIEIKVGSSSFVMTPESIQANNKTFPAPPPSEAEG